MELYGRKTIYGQEITSTNVIDEVRNSLTWHFKNVMQENYLYWYRRGKTPILERKKEVRPEICNKVNVNHANEVVAFKNGYFLQKPAFYRSRSKDEAIIELVKQYNDFLYVSGKNKADNKIVNNFHEMGIGVLYVTTNDDDTKPYLCYSLDPRENYVVYSRKEGNPPLYAVHLATAGDKVLIDVITPFYVYTLETSTQVFLQSEPAVPISAIPISLQKKEVNVIGKINMVEYFYNEERMSAFESAVSLMDAYNEVASNQVDGIAQFVQSLCVAVNCEFQEGTTANEIRKSGLLQLSNTGENKAEFKILSESLDQSQTQIVLDNFYEQILDKCSMPSTTKGGASTSDTGTAVYLRDGFMKADTDARNTEDLFKESNEKFDEIVLSILKRRVSLKGFPLEAKDFELNIERNSSSNLLVKTQGALNMKDLGLAPEIVLERSGISNDPLNDIEVSQKYIERVWNDDRPNEVAEDNSDSERFAQ